MNVGGDAGEVTATIAGGGFLHARAGRRLGGGAGGVEGPLLEDARCPRPARRCMGARARGRTPRQWATIGHYPRPWVRGRLRRNPRLGAPPACRARRST